MMQNAMVLDSAQTRYFVGGVTGGSHYLLDLITAVEVNDLQMLEFLRTFRAGLSASQVITPSSGRALLKWVLASMDGIFHDCSDPAKAVILEAHNADTITLHFELMRLILRNESGNW